MFINHYQPLFHGYFQHPALTSWRKFLYKLKTMACLYTLAEAFDCMPSNYHWYLLLMIDVRSAVKNYFKILRCVD